MSRLASGAGRRPAPARQDRYQRRFIRDVYRWIALGYEALDNRRMPDAHEEAITGAIVRHMTAIAEQLGAPAWLHHLVVIENTERNVRGLMGKARPRIDFEFLRTGPGARPRYEIEAKRLYRPDSVAEYVGSDGLGSFLTGDYAAEQAWAGMIGYVQNDESATWASRLETKLRKQRELYGLRPEDGSWRASDTIAWAYPAYETRHDRPPRQPIVIIHTLLSFC